MGPRVEVGEQLMEKIRGYWGDLITRPGFRIYPISRLHARAGFWDKEFGRWEGGWGEPEDFFLREDEYYAEGEQR